MTENADEQGPAAPRRGPFVLYGIPNCDKVRAARRWLAEARLPYRFHDLRRDGAPPELIGGWADRLGWEALLNRRGTSWRALPASERADLDHDRAVALMSRQPTLIRRPLLDSGSELLIGFDPPAYQALCAAQGASSDGP